MSLFSDIAQAIGHTIDSLAQDVGADASLLENIVNDLDGNGVNVLSAASRLHLSPVGFLRGIVNLMGSDPHQLLLQYLTGPFKKMDDPLYQLGQNWAQIGTLHQNTAQTINTHINELFAGNGTDSYSGTAADTLWQTHQDYHQYFTVLVEHAQTQQIRHATLGGHVNDYLGQVPSNVYNLSAPMAALGVLSLDTVTADAPSGLDQLIEGTGDNLQDLEQAQGPDMMGLEDPKWDIIGILIIALFLFLELLRFINWIAGFFTNHQNQQKNTTTPTPPAKPTPTPTTTPTTPNKPTHTVTPEELKEAQSLAAKYGIDVQLILTLLEQGYTIGEITALLIKLAQNARTNNPTKQARYITRQLQALINSWDNMPKEQYDKLRNLGYTDEQIRLMLMDRLSLADLIQRTQIIEATDLPAKLRAAGYSDEEIQRMLMAGLTQDQLEIIAQRTQKTPELRKMFNAIVNALLSGNSGKIAEAQVALCILDQVTIFDQNFNPTKPGLKNGQIDVGTDTTLIEVKQPNADLGGTPTQIGNLVDNFPGKSVILYAPGANDAPKNNVLDAGAKAVVGSCQELHAELK